jgi:RHS repeat-associated protein
MKRSPLCSFILPAILAWSAFGATALFGQYSDKAFSLRRSSELFDERGYQQSKSVSVDGKVVVSNSNGSLSYSYPISSYSAGGYPIQVGLTYCNAVAFTAFKQYSEASASSGSYAGWTRFEQNRPAWILGVNGFAMQVLSTTTHFHCDPSSPAYNKSRSSFSDKDLIWVVDGYDFCNRMIDFGAVGYDAGSYVDEIRLLRADGSVLELVNVNGRNSSDPDYRPELYTGHYISNEANNSGYGIVSFDQLNWPQYISQHAEDVSSDRRSPLLPRVLRYYPGDGLEYLFREWVVPYGTSAYADLASRSGGRYGGPTIFYLEEINGAAGPVASFGRSRHYPVVPGFESGMQWDSTRGRALFTGFDGHSLTYGTNSLRIEALGRTTTVKFDRIMPGGNATETTWMPLGMNGYTMSWQRMLAGLPETSSALYRSHLGYVTEIIDPEGRRTTFDYQGYSRSYQNYGFPNEPVAGSDVTLAARNLRLSSVVEPLMRYDISYYGDTAATLRYNTQISPYATNNVVRTIRRSDRSGSALTVNSFAYTYSGSSVVQSSDSLHDAVNGAARTMNYFYRQFLLPDLVPGRPQPRFTSVYRIDDYSPSLTSVTRTRYSTSADTLVASSWGSGTPIPKPAWGTPYLILPLETTVEVNNVLKSRQSFSYRFDTVRRFGGNSALTDLFGRETAERVVTTYDPARGVRLRTDTTDYLNLPMVDSSFTRLDSLLQKFAMIAEYNRLRALGEITASWEESMYDPRVVRYRVDTFRGRYRVPPQYGLERRQIAADSNGVILTGRSTAYHTAISTTDPSVTATRGSVAADSIIGSEGARHLALEYGYGVMLGRALPTSRRNANGSVARLYYDYALPSLMRTDREPDHPRGVARDNEDRADMVSIEGGEYFGLSLETPLADQQIVRRYTPERSLLADTLTQIYRRTFHGLVSGVIDPNGWYSRFDYDRNGRLKTAWLPFDFQSENRNYARELDAERTSEGYGSTRFVITYDTLTCADTVSYVAALPTTETITLYDRLYADNPAATRPNCPSCNQAEKEAPGIQATCHSSIPFMKQGGAVGSIDFMVLPPSVESIVRLDSAALLLNVSSVTGECLELRLDAPALGFSRTYVFNCASLLDNDDATGSTKEGSRPRIASDDGAIGRHDFRVDLTDYGNKLRTMKAGDRLGVTLTMLTSGGRAEILGGTNSEDTRPRLWLKGRFRTVNRLADNTLSYEYDDQAGSATIHQKVDDSLHSANRIDRTATLGDSRRSTSQNYFGPGGHPTLGRQLIGNPRSPSRIDSTRQAYTGSGQQIVGVNQKGDSVTSRYDAHGRLLGTRFEDHSANRVDYRAGTPIECGITDNLQDFHGFCAATISTSERGVTSVRYLDAFDRVRREVSDTAGLKLMVRYEYDPAGRLSIVINPGGDTTRYDYDSFGRKRRVWQPDIGTVSYSYDDVGNVRFTQTEQQSRDSLMTFNQYDDLDRITLIGEASFRQAGSWDHNGKPAGEGAPRIMSSSALYEPRLSDAADPRRLNDGGMSSILTANATLWIDPQSYGRSVPSAWPLGSLDSTTCSPGPSAMLGETDWPVPPFLRHAALYYQPVTVPGATLIDFENAARYPHFVRVAISYDTLPAALGTAWGALPPADLWHRLAPSGRIRNGRGHEVAVAYRDHGGEPFHYTMLSYDERGRVEATIRYTENLGFDAVYYRYNSMNQVISIRSADPFRTHTTWYGYDFNGRVDSIWTSLTPVGTGLSVTAPAYPAPSSRPDRAELVYGYNRTGKSDTIRFLAPDVTVAIDYTRRSWVDSIVAVRQGKELFAQRLGYSPSGDVVSQQWIHEGQQPVSIRYGYDDASRLTLAVQGSDSTSYAYDRNGNRISTASTSLASQSTAYYFYNPSAGPNRVANIDLFISPSNTPGIRSAYKYDPDGAVTAIERRDLAGTMLSEAHLDYSYRELTLGHTRGPVGGAARSEWRYRYSPVGEREQKRMYYSPAGDSGYGKRYGWVYYQLGGTREALAVFHGQQSSDPTCGTTGRSVRLYPVEYNTFAGGSALMSTAPSGAKSYRITDHLGTPRVVLDTGGAIISRHDYDPFGTPLPLAVGRHRFTGSERDIESGLSELGVRIYQSETGRFLSVDPHWEEYRATTPYHYCRNNPLSRIDPTGKWDIEVHVSKDRSKNGYGIAILKDRKGNEVFRFVVRVEGVGGRNRMNRNADTPLGTYDIPNHGTWISGGSRTAYGPNPRLALEGQSGEIAASGRSLIRLHGGRQEEVDPETGRYGPVDHPTLQKTHGCLRTFDNVMKLLKDATDRLERRDEQEEGGTLTIIDDLVEVNGTYQPPAAETGR